MTERATEDVGELIARLAAAADVPGLSVVDGTDYRVGDQVIVEVRGPTASFRLRPDIAKAAAHTPDAAGSAHGPEWVTFRPSTFDRYARDRIASWFEFAVREARG